MAFESQLIAYVMFSGARRLELRQNNDPEIAALAAYLLGNLNGGATSDNPFGNLGLMLMLGDNKDMGDLLPLMLMSGNSGLDMSNPLMMYLILGNGTMDKFLPLMFLANNTNNVAPAHTCTCGGHCGENHTQA